MRDEKDPGTLEMLPAKRGRPVLDPESGPMTAAEKQRRYRQNRAAQGNGCRRMSRVTAAGALEDFTDAVLLDTIRAELNFIRALERQGGMGMAPAKKRVGALAGELSRRYPSK